MWSIAGAFLVLEFAWPALLRWSIGAGVLPEELAMPTQEQMPTALVCRQQEVDAEEAATVDVEDPLAMREMRYASWMLGQQFGFAVSMANAGEADTQTVTLREDLQTWAAMLRLPTPTPPESRHLVSQLNDFTDHLVADPQCIAARLTRRYGPRYGYLYKFGAVVGYEIPLRAWDIGGPFALQIQFYGRKAGIPQELWQPLTLGSLADLPGAHPRDKVIRLVERIGEHIATSP
ncbi:MAG: hypothetical protein ACREJ0_14625 [Geminicoccaceae bacterium]